jgi:hypothetical protein
MENNSMNISLDDLINSLKELKNKNPLILEVTLYNEYKEEVDEETGLTYKKPSEIANLVIKYSFKP